MSRLSAIFIRLSMTPSLSATLAPPRITTNGRSGDSVRRLSTSTSAWTSPPHSVRQSLRNVIHACMLPVHDTEPVADEDICESRKLVSDGFGVVHRKHASVYDVAQRLPHAMGAVSYTHLRAHETVLDLVCRLLLEKKKQ